MVVLWLQMRTWLLYWIFECTNYFDDTIVHQEMKLHLSNFQLPTNDILLSENVFAPNAG